MSGECYSHDEEIFTDCLGTACENSAEYSNGSLKVTVYKGEQVRIKASELMPADIVEEMHEQAYGMIPEECCEDIDLPVDLDKMVKAFVDEQCGSIGIYTVRNVVQINAEYSDGKGWQILVEGPKA